MGYGGTILIPRSPHGELPLLYEVQIEIYRFSQKLPTGIKKYDVIENMSFRCILVV
jgi:hypothetical protein